MKLFGKISQTRTLVKICGLANEQDIKACAALGVDAVGFLLSDRDEGDKLTLDRAARLIQTVPKNVASVLLVKANNFEQIAEIVTVAKPTAVQLQNADLDLNCLKKLRAGFPSLEIIKTLRVDSDSTSTQLITSIGTVREFVDAVLLDSVKGGSGETHDWNLSAMVSDYFKLSGLPIVLAGGLNPENVENAIATVAPAMVDIMSGVSIQKGIKDLKKVKALVDVIHRI